MNKQRNPIYIFKATRRSSALTVPQFKTNKRFKLTGSSFFFRIYICSILPLTSETHTANLNSQHNFILINLNVVLMG